jgi:hypothetical protein
LRAFVLSREPQDPGRSEDKQASQMAIALFAAIALAVIGPMLGIVASRRLASSARSHLRIFASIFSISLSMPRSWLANPCKAARQRILPVVPRGDHCGDAAWPAGADHAVSVRCPLSAFLSIVR